VTLGIIIGSSLTTTFHSISMPMPCSGNAALSTNGDMTPGLHALEQVLGKRQKKTLRPEPLVQNFTDLPPPPELGANDAFAACLLIKDDNFWLIGEELHFLSVYVT
jgi:hypothetical protein